MLFAKMYDQLGRAKLSTAVVADACRLDLAECGVRGRESSNNHKLGHHGDESNDFCVMRLIMFLPRRCWTHFFDS